MLIIINCAWIFVHKLQELYALGYLILLLLTFQGMPGHLFEITQMSWSRPPKVNKFHFAHQTHQSEASIFLPMAGEMLPTDCQFSQPVWSFSLPINSYTSTTTAATTVLGPISLSGDPLNQTSHIAKTILNQYKINQGCNAIQCNTMHLSYNASLFPLFSEVYICLGFKVILQPWHPQWSQ